MNIPSRTLFAVVSLSLLGAVAPARAAIILLEDFEDSTISYTSTLGDPGASDGAGSYYGRLGPTGISTTDTYNNAQGSGFFGAQNTTGAPGIGGGVITWTGIDITGLTELKFSAMFAELGDQWDPNSQLLVQIKVDGVGPYSGNEIFSLQSSSDSTSNTSAFVDLDFDGIGEGTEITDTFQRLSAIFAVNGSTLDLRILILGLTEPGEGIVFDQLMLSTTPEPASMALMGMFACGVIGSRVRRRRKAKSTSGRSDEIPSGS